jgi:hypothetical protein
MKHKYLKDLDYKSLIGIVGLTGILTLIGAKFVKDCNSYYGFVKYFRNAQQIEKPLEPGQNITKICRDELKGTEWENWVSVCRELVLEENRITDSDAEKLRVGYRLKMRDLNGDGKIGK